MLTLDEARWSELKNSLGIHPSEINAEDLKDSFIVSNDLLAVLVLFKKEYESTILKTDFTADAIGNYSRQQMRLHHSSAIISFIDFLIGKSEYNLSIQAETELTDMEGKDTNTLQMF